MNISREDKIRFICSISNKPVGDASGWSDQEVSETYDKLIHFLNHMG